MKSVRALKKEDCDAYDLTASGVIRFAIDRGFEVPTKRKFDEWEALFPDGIDEDNLPTVADTLLGLATDYLENKWFNIYYYFEKIEGKTIGVRAIEKVKPLF